MRDCAFLLAALWGLGLLPAPAAAGSTERVSVSSRGQQADAASATPSISADGRFVAFHSKASNLVGGDRNGLDDIFVHDRLTRRVVRVSVSSTGEESDGWSIRPAISANGRYVVFESAATNLVRGDGNGVWDVFVHDLKTGRTRRVSVSSGGEEGNDASLSAAISHDGRVVVFASRASNLVAGDTNGTWDIFAHDLESGLTSRVSVSSWGQQGAGASILPAISTEGRFVAFVSSAPNLVPGDRNNRDDVFVHDRLTGVTRRVSVSSRGTEGNRDSGSSSFLPPSISADGRFVAFSSLASNLVDIDLNRTWDVFVHDVYTGTTRLASVDAHGAQGNSWSLHPSISADGRYVGFQSAASNLVPDDGNGAADVFVHDLKTGSTVRFSVDSSGEEGNGPSARRGVSVSAFGHSVAFESQAGNLVPGDTNQLADIFVRDFFPLLASDLPRVGQRVTLYLYAPSSPGRVYVLGASAHMFPGIQVDARTIPLSADPLLVFSLHAPAVFERSTGVLDEQGWSAAAIHIPAIPALAGQTFYAAFITLSRYAPSGVEGISNAVKLTVGL